MAAVFILRKKWAINGAFCRRLGTRPTLLTIPMAYSPIDPKTLVRRAGEWLRTEGPDADVVVSCRVRLARNLAGEPFVARLEAERAIQIASRLKDVLLEARIDGETSWVSMLEVRAPRLVRESWYGL